MKIADADLILARAANRVASDDGFMASLLRTQGEPAVDFERVASDLGVTPDCVIRLSLCRRPSGTSPRFRDDVQSMSRVSGVPENAIAILVRRAEALRALQGTAPAMLAAAQDASLSSPPAEDDE